MIFGISKIQIDDITLYYSLYIRYVKIIQTFFTSIKNDPSLIKKWFSAVSSVRVTQHITWNQNIKDLRNVRKRFGESVNLSEHFYSFEINVQIYHLNISQCNMCQSGIWNFTWLEKPYVT